MWQLNLAFPLQAFIHPSAHSESLHITYLSIFPTPNCLTSPSIHPSIPPSLPPSHLIHLSLIHPLYIYPSVLPLVCQSIDPSSCLFIHSLITLSLHVNPFIHPWSTHTHFSPSIPSHPIPPCIHPSARTSVHPHTLIYISIHLVNRPILCIKSIHPFMFPWIHPSLMSIHHVHRHPTVHPLIYSSFNPSLSPLMHPFGFPHFIQSTNSSFHPIIHWFIHLSIH